MSIGRVPGVTGIQPSIVDAKGDLIVATAADSVDRLAVGTNEQRLVADSATATGLKYVADTTNYAIAAKGDLLVGTGADTLAALTVGTNGHTLVADSSTATGLKWAAPDPLTTKGDLFTFSTTEARLGVGANGTVLTADSAEATGLKWATPASGGMTLISSQSMSGVSSVTFNSIAGTYNNLQLILRGYYASSGTPILQWELNSDTTTTNYFGVADVYRTGTSINQELWNTKNLVGSGMTYRTTSTSYNHLVIDLFDYTNTAAWKNCFIQGFQLTDYSATNRAYIYGNLAWTDTSAVTSIKILNSDSNNWSGGTALLYGVK